MTVRLHTLVAEAEAALTAEDQARLAELVEAFVATHQEGQDFSAEELADLARLDAGPTVPADPAEVAALFARRA